MEPKHSAIAAGLALTLAFGSVAAPKPAVAEDTTPGVASDATNIDKGLYTEQSLAGTLRSVSGVNLVNVSDEMKYFTKYESHGNYNQGFSYGDGYNALGYYQFDRRWSLIPFMRQVYNYNPAKYSMLKTAIDRGSEISSSSNVMYSNGQLTELGRIAQDAFQGAYAADPVEFSALQDSYAYNSYYAVTESWLKSSLGIDISGRADCVKGMVWSITNMCGTGGCQDFFRWANLSNSMTDREFVTALSNSVVNNAARKYPKQTQYHAGWQNRYRSELKDCLVYIAEDEAAAATKPSEPAGDAGNGADSGSGSNAGSNDATSNDDATNDDSSNDASNNSAAIGSVSNDAASGSSNDKSSSTSSSTDKADSKTDAANSGNATDDSSGGSAATDSDSKADDKTEAGSTDSKGSDESEGKVDSKDSDGETKDETSSASKNDKSDAEKLGEAVGDALTSGLSKAESESKSSDGKDDASKTQKSSDDSSAQDAKSSDNDSKSDAKKDEQKQDAQKQDEQKKGGNAATPTSADKSANGNNNKTSTNGGMPRTGDIVIMASLASASLATFGMTAIVSGKNKLKGQDENDSGDNDQA